MQQSHSDWQLSILSNEVVLPNLSELADFMGNQSLKNLLPSNSDKLVNIILSNLVLNLVGSTISEFSFGVKYANAAGENQWEIIPNELIFKDFTIYFSLSTTSAGTHEVAGLISGILEIDNIDVFLEAKYDNGWTFIGKIQAINFESITKQFSVELPEFLSSIDIEELGITYHTISRTLIFDAEINNTKIFVYMTKGPEASGTSTQAEWQTVAGLSYDSKLDLMSYIPLVHNLPPDELGLNSINVLYASADMEYEDPFPASPTSPKQMISVKQGLTYQATIEIAGTEYVYPIATPNVSTVTLTREGASNIVATTSPSTSASASSVPSSGTGISIPIQKAIGPLMFEKLGIGLQSNNIMLSIDVGVTSSGLSIELIGFSVSINTSDSFTVASTCNNEENSFLISVTKLSNGRNNKRYYARNDQCK
jgi:hypothetical protein